VTHCHLDSDWIVDFDSTGNQTEALPKSDRRNPSKIGVTNAAQISEPTAITQSSPIIPSQSATNRIHGAFGLKLGDAFDTNGVHGNGLDEYNFSPTNTYRDLSEYLVRITPNSHQIYSIEAYGTFPDQTKGDAAERELKKYLIVEYDSDGGGDEKFRLTVANRFVLGMPGQNDLCFICKDADLLIVV
jgi:hypothetical protein